MGSGEARAGLAGASPVLPRRVRGMNDGPRPPAQVARPALPASFLERVRAAAEAEQRLEERTQERAGQPADLPAVQPGPPRRSARFVRSRDWMARNTDKKDRGGGDQPRPEARGKAEGDQSGAARQARASSGLWTAHRDAEPDQAQAPAGPGALGTDGAGAGTDRAGQGTDGSGAGPAGAAKPSSPPALPRRKPRVSHRRNPGQAELAAPASAAAPTGEASTEPIPVIRVSATGEPLRPEGADQGIPALDGKPVTAAVQAPDQTAAPNSAERAPVEQAPVEVEQAPVEQAPAEQVSPAQAPVAPDMVAPATPGTPPGHARRSRGKAGLRARVARGLAAEPQSPAGPEDPERQDARKPAPEPAREEVAAQGTAAAAERQAAARRAQQAAARRAADEVIVQRAAALLARKSSPAWTRRRVGLAVVAVLVLGGVTAAFAFLGTGGHPGHRSTSNSGPTAVVNRDRAAAWVVSQVSPATVVSCDLVTCKMIESHGFSASQLRILGPGKANPLVSDVVVATPAVRRQFGAQLISVYAPGMLATFGSGSGQVDIQLVAPHGAAAYRAALNADLQNRRQSGAGLAGSDRILAPFIAQKQLETGQVDSRLMITLALMASLQPVHLVTFGNGGPDLDTAPLRSAQISLTGSAQKKAALTFLRLQQPPYQPAHVTTKSLGRDRTLLIMGFTAPSPVGLFH